MRTDVLIVGAGPAGLLVANLLARAHVNFILLDKKTGPIDESRAILIHGRTLELLDKLDLADPAIADGQKMTGVHILIDGKQKVFLHLDASGEQISPYGYSLVHEQSKTERLLLRGVEEFPAAIHLIAADNYALQKIYGARTPRLFLIRPDGYIAYSGRPGKLPYLSQPRIHLAERWKQADLA